MVPSFQTMKFKLKKKKFKLIIKKISKYYNLILNLRYLYKTNYS